MLQVLYEREKKEIEAERVPKEFCISLSFSWMTVFTSVGSRRNHCKHHSNTALQWESHAGKGMLVLVSKPHVCRICCLQYAEFVAYSMQNLLLVLSLAPVFLSLAVHFAHCK